MRWRGTNSLRTMQRLMPISSRFLGSIEPSPPFRVLNVSLPFRFKPLSPDAAAKAQHEVVGRSHLNTDVLKRGFHDRYCSRLLMLHDYCLSASAHSKRLLLLLRLFLL